MELKKLVVASGDYKGRYIGQNVFGVRTNPELLKIPEVPIVGTGYSMYAQEGAAIQFFESNLAHMQAELKKRGIETEIAD
jgi:hypothetical protein